MEATKLYTLPYNKNGGNKTLYFIKLRQDGGNETSIVKLTLNVGNETLYFNL